MRWKSLVISLSRLTAKSRTVKASQRCKQRTVTRGHKPTKSKQLRKLLTISED